MHWTSPLPIPCLTRVNPNFMQFLEQSLNISHAASFCRPVLLPVRVASIVSSRFRSLHFQIALLQCLLIYARQPALLAVPFVSLPLWPRSRCVNHAPPPHRHCHCLFKAPYSPTAARTSRALVHQTLGMQQEELCQ